MKTPQETLLKIITFKILLTLDQNLIFSNPHYKPVQFIKLLQFRSHQLTMADNFRVSHLVSQIICMNLLWPQQTLTYLSGALRKLSQSC